MIANVKFIFAKIKKSQQTTDNRQRIFFESEKLKN